MANLSLRFDTESAMVFTGYSGENREERISEACAAVTQICIKAKRSRQIGQSTVRPLGREGRVIFGTQLHHGLKPALHATFTSDTHTC